MAITRLGTFVCIKHFNYITMREYTIPSSVCSNIASTRYSCTHARTNKTKQKRNLYNIFSMHITHLLKKEHIHRSLAQNSPYSAQHVSPNRVLTLLLHSSYSTSTGARKRTLTLVKCPPPQSLRCKLRENA